VETIDHVFRSETEHRFGGQIDQFRGDGLVASLEQAAPMKMTERAVLAGLVMQHRMEEYAAELQKQLNIDLKLRVGVNTGEVIVMSIGDERQHREDTAMGEAIAIAARMEEAAQPGTVLVSENTYRLVTSDFRWEPLGEILVKGLTSPIAVFRPLQHLPSADSGLKPRISLYSYPDRANDGLQLLSAVLKNFTVAAVDHHHQRRTGLAGPAGYQCTSISNGRDAVD
jgi:class 3 adenylate cyclase